MHPKIEAVFPHVLPLPEEEIWKKILDENWYGLWWLVSDEYWMDELEKIPEHAWRAASFLRGEHPIEYYDGNFCIIGKHDQYALLWHPPLQNG